MNAAMHGYDEKRFPLTAAQGRVLYHAERIFRSAGGPGCIAAQTWRDACAEAALPVLVSKWTTAQCVLGLNLIEWAARKHRMHQFRDVRTGWEDFAPALEVGVNLHRIVERRRVPVPAPVLVTMWAAEGELL